MNTVKIINSKSITLIFLVLLLAGSLVACYGGAGVVRPGVSIHHDIYYRNPWHRYDRFPPPRYIGPPPVIGPPPIKVPPPVIEPPPIAIPPVAPPVFEAVPLPM